VLWFANTIHAQEKPPQAPAAVISAPPDPAFPGAVDSMAGDRTTLVNMDRNHDLTDNPFGTGKIRTMLCSPAVRPKNAVGTTAATVQNKKID
jgi:hypothetical protein